MNNSSGKFPDVVGYITQAERVALQRCVLDTSHVPGDALEIGSLNGLSALLILSVLESDKKLICVERGQVDTLSKNLVKHKLERQVSIVNMDFNNMISFNEKLSFAFIDHNHSMADTNSVFLRLWPNISIGGLMLFHDYGHPDFKDGTLAIETIMKENNLAPHLRADSLIAFKKPAL